MAPPNLHTRVDYRHSLMSSDVSPHTYCKQQAKQFSEREEELKETHRQLYKEHQL